MRLPRMTTRRLMALMAVAAVATGAWVEATRLARISAYYRYRSLYFRFCDQPPMARQRWARQMAEKYERAARYPWLPVPPDLPEPK